jgi:plastocyanin
VITGLCGRVSFRIVFVCGVLASGAGVVLSAGQPAATGRIDGQVTLVVPSGVKVPSGVYPSRRVSGPAPKASEIANVVVFLKGITPYRNLAPSSATIRQTDETFKPAVVAVTRGSTVSFPNFDPFFHNVFSLSRGSTFDLGRYPRGESRTRTLTQAGLVKVYCHLHSHMSASIMVFDHPFFDVPAADGRFRLDGIPPGSYRISAWHPRIGESTHDVSVEAGKPATVEFVLPVEAQ